MVVGGLAGEVHGLPELYAAVGESEAELDDGGVEFVVEKVEAVEVLCHLGASDGVGDELGL